MAYEAGYKLAHSGILKYELCESGLRLSQVALTALVANLLKYLIATSMALRIPHCLASRIPGFLLFHQLKNLHLARRFSRPFPGSFQISQCSAVLVTEHFTPHCSPRASAPTAAPVVLGGGLRLRAVSSPPCLVPAAVAHARSLIDARQLLEAYVCLRELEQLQEETWAPLGGLELPVFEGLGPLAEALGQAVEAAAGAAGRLAREDPARLVAAVRVAEVDAGYTASLELAPRGWRQRCLQALQEGLDRTHFGTPLLPEPGALAGWLEALRVALPAELATAEALVAPCCPPHYKVVRLWAHTLHSGLRRCLQQLLGGPELGAAEAFTLLHWALRVYLGSVPSGHREVGASEAGGSQ